MTWKIPSTSNEAGVKVPCPRLRWYKGPPATMPNLHVGCEGSTNAANVDPHAIASWTLGNSTGVKPSQETQRHSWVRHGQHQCTCPAAHENTPPRSILSGPFQNRHHCDLIFDIISNIAFYMGWGYTCTTKSSNIFVLSVRISNASKQHFKMTKKRTNMHVLM